MNKTIPTVDNSIRRLRAYLGAESISPSAAAVRAGLSINALRDIHKDGWSPNADTLRAAEKIIPTDFLAEDEAA